MFTRQNMQGAEHSDGYSLQMISRFEMEYREDPRVLEADAQSPATMSLWRAAQLRWKWPHADEPISQEKCDQIRQRVIDALTFINSPAQ